MTPRFDVISSRSARALVLLSALAACGTDSDAASVPSGNGGALADGSATPQSDAGGYDGSASAANDAGVTVQTNGDGGCGVVKAETQPQKGAVDVIWVIDDSASMLPQVLPVGDNMARFLTGVRQGGGDISVVMVTGPIIGSYLAGTITDMNYHWLAAPVQSHDAFSWALNTYPDWSKLTRPGAALHFVFVSDDFSDMASADFLTRMTSTAKQPFTAHAVATKGLGSDCMGFPPFVGGKDYYDAAAATGGEQLSLCGDWGAGFDKLQSSVVASVPLPCSYPIPAPPDGERLDPEAVQVLYTAAGGAAAEFARATDESKCADNLAWRFDTTPNPTSVVMCPKACEAVKAGGAIAIGFGCAPSVVLR